MSTPDYTTHEIQHGGTGYNTRLHDTRNTTRYRVVVEFSISLQTLSVFPFRRIPFRQIPGLGLGLVLGLGLGLELRLRLGIRDSAKWGITAYHSTHYGSLRRHLPRLVHKTGLSIQLPGKRIADGSPFGIRTEWHRAANRGNGESTRRTSAVYAI